MTKLNGFDALVYDAISRWWQEYDYGPSVRDLVDSLPACNSTSGVLESVRRLKWAGMIEWPTDRYGRQIAHGIRVRK
jgi:hypothetical protein